MRPVITTVEGRPVSSWGERDGMWCDEQGVPRPRSYWAARYGSSRGRPPAIRPDLYDEARQLRLLYLQGAVTAAQVAGCLGIHHRAANRFLSYEVLWWL